MSSCIPGSKLGSALRLSIVISTIAILAPPAARAQEDSGLVGGIPVQFSLVPPGARSLSMGGAFVGFANDASSAWTNPAGLVSLSSPEVSLEYRHVSSPGGSEEYAQRVTPRTGTVKFDASSTDSLSFFSYVYPKERYAFGLFYQELARQDRKGAIEDAFFGGASFESRSRFELTIPGLGASAAVKVGEHVSFGASLAYYGIDMTSTFNSRFGRQETTRLVESDENAIGGGVGGLWSNDTIRLGAVYRFGPKFDARSTFICTENIIEEPNDRRCKDTAEGDLVDSNEPAHDTTFPVPDSYGVGFAWQVTDTFSVGFDVIRTEYSELAKESSAAFTNKQVQFEVDDATEPHLGVEWGLKLKTERYLYLRGGGWLEADHRLIYKRPANPEDPDYSPTLDQLFPSEPQDSEFHATVGVGYVAGEKWQVDLAGDFSGWSDIASLSFVYRF